MRGPSFAVHVVFLLFCCGGFLGSSRAWADNPKDALLVEGQMTVDSQDGKETHRVEFFSSGKKWRLVYTDEQGDLAGLTTYDGNRICDYSPREHKLLISKPGLLSAFNQYYRLRCHFMGPYLPLVPQPTVDYQNIPVYPLPSEVFDHAGRIGKTDFWSLSEKNGLNLNEPFKIYAHQDLSNGLLRTSSDPQSKKGGFLIGRDSADRTVSLSRYDEKGKPLYEMAFSDYRKFASVPIPVACTMDGEFFSTQTQEAFCTIHSEIKDIRIISGKGIEYSIPPSVASEIKDEISGVTVKPSGKK